MTNEEKEHLGKLLSRIHILEATYRNASEEAERCRDRLSIAQTELAQLLAIVPKEPAEPHNY